MGNIKYYNQTQDRIKGTRPKNSTFLGHYTSYNDVRRIRRNSTKHKVYGRRTQKGIYVIYIKPKRRK